MKRMYMLKKISACVLGWILSDGIPHTDHIVRTCMHIKGLIKCLHHTVTRDENPHFCATCSLSRFETPQCTRFTLPSLSVHPHAGRHPPHCRQFPQWEHFNHDGRNIHPHPLHPPARAHTHTLPVIHSFLTHILWEDKRRALSDP